MGYAHERGFGGPHPDRREGQFEFRIDRSRGRGGTSLCLDVTGLSADQAHRLEINFLSWSVGERKRRAEIV